MDKLKLPSILKPYGFAKKELKLVNQYNLADVLSLKGAVKSGVLNIEIKFKMQERIATATGTIDFKAKIPCVNCKESLDFNFKGELNIAFVDDKELERTRDSFIEGYEIVNCSFGSEINTFDLIADEVLLALPMFAKHSNSCIKQISEDANFSKKENPFAKLKDILDK